MARSLQIRIHFYFFSALMRSIYLSMLMLCLSGCSAFSWLPFIDGDDEKKKLEPAKLVKFEAEVRFEKLWRASIGKGLGKKYLRMDPAVVADRVYAADAYGKVEARDRFTGKLIWNTTVGAVPKSGRLGSLNFLDRKDPSFLSGGVGAGSGYVLLGTTLGEVVAVSARDGGEVWRAFVGAEVLSSPTTGSGLVFLQTVDGRLVALNDSTGETAWTFDNQLPVLTLRGTGNPVYSSNIVYAGFANGKLSAVRAKTGELLWETRIMLPEGRSELDRLVDIDGSPLLTGNLIFAVAYQGKAKALRREDGAAVWEHPVSSFLDLAEGYGQIYIVSDGDIIEAIDQQSGDVSWTNDALVRRKLTSPIAYSNYVLVGDSEGYLHAIAQSDGRFVGRIKIDGKGLRSDISVKDGIIYVLGNSGSMFALKINSG